jgi:maleylacetoacetate isomerase
MLLYSYYQSSASYRVRIALNLKNIEVEMRYIDLTKAQQHDDSYQKINPQKLVPALVLDSGEVLTQSLAIIEYLDAAFEGAPLLPSAPVARAHCRAMAMLVAGDIATINNLKIRQYLSGELQHDKNTVTTWIQHWIIDGFDALESQLRQSSLTGRYCIGDKPTMADFCLIPQIFNAKRFAVDMHQFPTISRIDEACNAHEAFIRAAPMNQPDAPQQAA